MVLFDQNDYRAVLKTALEQKASSANSLGASAERLGVSKSFLSEVLNGKKSLSMELAFKLSVKLGFTERETQYFCLLVQQQQEKDPTFKAELAQRLKDFSPRNGTHRLPVDLSTDLFMMISDWCHTAIMELTYLPGFKLNPESAADFLGITKAEAQVAIDRLLRLELLTESKKGLTKTHSHLFSEANEHNQAFKQLHRHILGRAAEALVSQHNGTERISATDIVAFDSKYIPKVDKLSREFSAAVIKLAEKSKAKNSVYALSTHFLRLNRKVEKV